MYIGLHESVLVDTNRERRVFTNDCIPQ